MLSEPECSILLRLFCWLIQDKFVTSASIAVEALKGASGLSVSRVQVWASRVGCQRNPVACVTVLMAAAASMGVLPASLCGHPWEAAPTAKQD